MAKSIKETNLGKFLTQISADRLEIHYKTDIQYGKIVKMANNKANLSLFDFYSIAKSLESETVSLSMIADRVFENYNQVTVPSKDPETGNQFTKFGKFFYKFLNSKSSIKEKFNISTESLTKSLFENDDEINAIDIYSLCKYFNQNFVEVMEELCSHLALTTPEREKELRQLYKEQLNNRKNERDLAIKHIKSASEEEYFIKEHTIQDFITYTKSKYNILLKESYVRAELNNLVEQGIFKKSTIDKENYYSSK